MYLDTTKSLSGIKEIDSIKTAVSNLDLCLIVEQLRIIEDDTNNKQWSGAVLNAILDDVKARLLFE